MKQLIYGLLLTTAIISCSRDENPVQVDNTPLVPVQVDDIKYTYTEGNKLETITKGKSVYTFKYEGDLIKSIKTESSLETIFEYDNQQRLTRAYTTNGVEEIKYIYNGEQTESISTTKRTYYRTINGIPDNIHRVMSKHFVYSIENGNVISVAGRSWDDDPKTPADENTPFDVKIWLEQDKNENFAKNIKGLDKINLYLIDKNMFKYTGILGNKNNTIHTEYISNGFRSLGQPFDTGYSYEGTAYLLEYVYNEKNIAVGFKMVSVIFDTTYQGNKGERGKAYTEVFPIKYNK